MQKQLIDRTRRLATPPMLPLWGFRTNATIVTQAIFAALASLALSVAAETVPAQLPDPDGKPGDATKPVKVYILAGQSNMVGMGDLAGAKSRYAGVYLTSDPNAPRGPLHVGRSLYKIDSYTLTRLDGALTKEQEPLAEGYLEVPVAGTYRIDWGQRTNPGARMILIGEEIRGEVTLKVETLYRFKLTGFRGAPPRFWLQQTDLVGHGDLESVTKRNGKFPYLVDEEGNWTVRNDVYFQEARLAKDGEGSPLSATSNGRSIGPELGFGHVLGTFHDEQVLLIKTAQGNRALGFDFRPPSSGRTAPDNEFEAAEYRLMIEGVRKTLANIEKVVPGYKGQGYEIAGFAWWQGHKDGFSPELIAEYEKNLVNLINDLRAEFEVPKMPAVIATVGFGGHGMGENYLQILEAQMAVADAEKHPELAGTVATVDTRGFWRTEDESPVPQGHHYNRNAETYMLVGDALGREMVKLLGGTAEPSPELEASAKRPKLAAKPSQPAAEPTPEEIAKRRAALRPILVDGLLPEFIEKNRAVLEVEASMVQPKRVSPFLRGKMDDLTSIYRQAGIDEYEWKAFGPDLRNTEWEYFSFDPVEARPVDGRPRYRKVTYPEGMADWFGSGFHAAGAGWKRGLPPFGQLDGKLAPLSETCTQEICGCGNAPRTLWEKEVLLLRKAFDLPPLKDGHRYRIVIGGSAHVNGGEGYAIYLDGKQLTEVGVGVGTRQGAQPRGVFLHEDVVKEYRSGGKVTLAVTSFLRYHHPRIKPFPPRGHITAWLEEMKTPPLNE